MPSSAPKPESRVSALWAMAAFALGLTPSLLLFVWIERNCSLPMALFRQYLFDLHWPWLDLASAPMAARAALDALLVLAFGVIHTALAQAGPQAWLSARIGVANVRAFFLVVTGLTALGLMGCWQNTGLILWVLPLSWEKLNLVSIGLFWSFTLSAFWSLTRFGALEFVGLRAQSSNMGKPGSEHLVTDGLHGVVRHPTYLFTLLAFGLTPFMSLDRMVFLLSVATYLSFGIPIEERKLHSRFGAAYESYRARVPALIPRLWARSGTLSGPGSEPKGSRPSG